MTLGEIRSRVEKIKEEVGDDGTQHSIEDALHLDFIRYVSKYGNKELAILAEEILLVDKMPFARWCA